MSFTDVCLVGIIATIAATVLMAVYAWSLPGAHPNMDRRHSMVKLVFIGFTLIALYWFGYFEIKIIHEVDRDIFYHRDIFYGLAHAVFTYMFGLYLNIHESTAWIIVLFTVVQHYVMSQGVDKVEGGERWTLFAYACVAWVIIQYCLYAWKNRANQALIPVFINAVLSSFYLILFGMQVCGNVWTLETATLLNLIVDIVYFCVFGMYLIYWYGTDDSYLINNELHTIRYTMALYQLVLASNPAEKKAFDNTVELMKKNNAYYLPPPPQQPPPMQPMATYPQQPQFMIQPSGGQQPPAYYG